MSKFEDTLSEASKQVSKIGEDAFKTVKTEVEKEVKKELGKEVSKKVDEFGDAVKDTAGDLVKEGTKSAKNAFQKLMNKVSTKLNKFLEKHKDNKFVQSLANFCKKVAEIFKPTIKEAGKIGKKLATNLGGQAVEILNNKLDNIKNSVNPQIQK